MKTRFAIFAAAILLLAGCTKEITQPSVEIDMGQSSINSALGEAVIVAHVTDDGGELTDAGICYAGSTPTIYDNPHSVGSNKEIRVELHGLTEGIYYVRAYAVNRTGTAYSSLAQITIASVPTVVLGNCTYNASQGTATLNGTVTSNGGSTVTEAGFVYLKGTSGTPTTANNKVRSYNTTNLSANLSGLSDGTYRVRAYAINSQGTAYSSDIKYFTISRGSGTRTINDVVGTYSASAYSWDDSQWESWSGMTIQTISGYTDFDLVVDGFSEKDFLVACGKWDEANQCIRLKASWHYASRTFTFNNDPDNELYAVFYPVYAVNIANNDYYWCSTYADNSNYEILLKFNSSGQLVLTSPTQADANGHTSNAIGWRLFQASDNEEYTYRWTIFSSLTMTKTN